MTEEKTAAKLAKKLAAFLYIVGGQKMERHGFVEHSHETGWVLTQKGIHLFHQTLARMPTP